MQKNRNRCIKNNFEFSKEFLQSLPNLDKVNVNINNSNVRNEKQYFGESVSQNKEYSNESESSKRHSTHSFDRDSLTNESDLDIISFGKSSSSSISWCEDFDTEATVRVQDELAKMERILQGKEAIPPHYNKEEYKLWISTFPQISITGDSNDYNTQCERFGATSSDNIDIFKNSKVSNVCNSIKLEKMTNEQDIPLNKSRNPRISFKSTKDLESTTNFYSYSDDFNSILKISPVHLEESGNRSNYLSTRQQSSRSVSTSEKLASKWMRGDVLLDYSSLPYISTSAKEKVNSTVIRKKSSKLKHSSNSSLYKGNCVSLPPIKTISFPSANEFRSSITPRIQTKSTVSASIPLQIKVKKSKYRHETSDCDIELNSFHKLRK